MARKQNIGTSEDWFVGENKTLSFEIFSSDEVTMQNVVGFAMRWVLRRSLEGDPIILSKTTGGATITVTGVYNADQDINTQRVNVLIVGNPDTYRLQPGKFNHALKRTDDDTILSYGEVELKKAAL